MDTTYVILDANTGEMLGDTTHSCFSAAWEEASAWRHFTTVHAYVAKDAGDGRYRYCMAGEQLYGDDEERTRCV